MALSRRIARPLLASVFVVGGFEAVRSPAEKVDKARVVTEPLREETGMAALDTEAVVRINGAVQIFAAMLLAVGKVRRLACFFLMCSLIPRSS
jgi:putative oxidoreductase